MLTEVLAAQIKDLILSGAGQGLVVSLFPNCCPSHSPHFWKRKGCKFCHENEKEPPSFPSWYSIQDKLLALDRRISAKPCCESLELLYNFAFPIHSGAVSALLVMLTTIHRTSELLASVLDGHKERKSGPERPFLGEPCAQSGVLSETQQLQEG